MQAVLVVIALYLGLPVAEVRIVPSAECRATGQAIVEDLSEIPGVAAIAWFCRDFRFPGRDA